MSAVKRRETNCDAADSNSQTKSNVLGVPVDICSQRLCWIVEGKKQTGNANVQV